MTANDLTYTVAKHSFPYSFDSDKDQAFNSSTAMDADPRPIFERHVGSILFYG